MTYNRRSFLQQIAASAAALALTGRAGAQSLPNNTEVALNFAIKPPTETGRYHKPYVAVWVETPGGQMVRTVTLWKLQEEKGVKWLKDLRKWFRSATERDSVRSSATRGVGEYEVVWDGNDDKGKRVASGEYILFVEAAREKGPYGRVRIPLTLNGTATTAEGKGAGDLGDVKVSVRNR